MMKNKMYYIYHVPGKKIGVTTSLRHRLELQQGYSKDDYVVLEKHSDIDKASAREKELQIKYGYPVDVRTYKRTVSSDKVMLGRMKLNITQSTTTFPCPLNKLKGRLMDVIGESFIVNGKKITITKDVVDFIMKYAQTSNYRGSRCYIYNKKLLQVLKSKDMEIKKGAELRYPYWDEEYQAAPVKKKDVDQRFDLIREWASKRGIYDNGDAKTQFVKLMEEAGELAQSLLKSDKPEIVDAIGDMVVVLTNLAHLSGCLIEDCIDSAYSEISGRTGKMINGTFVKDE